MDLKLRQIIPNSSKRQRRAPLGQNPSAFWAIFRRAGEKRVNDFESPGLEWAGVDLSGALDEK
jgi:hypothetical protein